MSFGIPMTDKARIAVAFRALRSEGLRGSIFVRQSFSCCGGCGCSEISDMKGVCAWAFYTKQQAHKAFNEEGNLTKQVALVWGLGLAHRAVEGTHPDHAEAMTEWGNKIVTALAAVGLDCRMGRQGLYHHPHLTQNHAPHVNGVREQRPGHRRGFRFAASHETDDGPWC
jgi:hypothetical protein